MLNRSTLIVFMFAMLFAAGQLHAGGEAVVKKTKIVMGGTTLGIRNTTQQDMEIAFNAALRDYLKSSNTDLRIVIYPSTRDLYAAFDNREIDGIFGTAVEYLGREDQFGKEVMALKYKNTGLKQSYVVVARKSGGIARIEDMKHKRLTLAKYQDTEEMYLNTLLLKRKLPEIPAFFSERLDAKNPNVAIMDVFFDKSDVTIVRESEYRTATELNPQINKKLFVVEQSLPYLPAMGSVRKDIARESIDDLMIALRRYGESQKGGNVLRFSQADSIDTIALDEIQSVRDLLMEYQSLKKTSVLKSTAAPATGAKPRIKRNAQ